MLSDQPITDLRVTLKTIQRNREEEELLRSQETAPVRPTHEMETNGQDPLARGSATPVPSGEELSPSEADLDPDEEPDLREMLNMTRREREKPEEEPDLREMLIKTRRVIEKPSTEAPEIALETDPERDPGPEEREEGELASQSSPTQTGQQVTPNDPGECSTSSDETYKVNKFTPFRDECEEVRCPSPKTFPRAWKIPKIQEDDRDGPPSPPSPLYQTEPAGHEAATTNSTHASGDPHHDNLEMLARDPSTSGTQKKKKKHSPIIYRNCHTHEDTSRRSIWDRVGQRDKPSVKRRLDWQHTSFDRNRLGTRAWPPTETERSKKNWSNWKMSGVWEVWKPDMVPRCAEFNRRTWLPQQEPEWNNEWRRERSHTPGGTSNCPQNEDSDNELGGN
jgi:hypothetical protein